MKIIKRINHSPVSFYFNILEVLPSHAQEASVADLRICFRERSEEINSGRSPGKLLKISLANGKLFLFCRLYVLIIKFGVKQDKFVFLLIFFIKKNHLKQSILLWLYFQKQNQKKNVVFVGSQIHLRDHHIENGKVMYKTCNIF